MESTMALGAGSHSTRWRALHTYHLSAAAWTSVEQWARNCRSSPHDHLSKTAHAANGVPFESELWTEPTREISPRCLGLLSCRLSWERIQPMYLCTVWYGVNFWDPAPLNTLQITAMAPTSVVHLPSELPDATQLVESPIWAPPTLDALITPQ